MGGVAKSGWVRHVRAGVVTGIAVLALLTPSAARADLGFIGKLGNFLIPGGYFLTSDRARDALNDSLWYRESDIFRYSLGVGLAGGALSFKAISASSQITPFTGNTQFHLFGPSVQVWTAKTLGFRPYASAGIFGAQVKTRSEGTSDWVIMPSGTLGFQYSFTPVTTLTAEYRMSTREVGGINTDGFALRLMLF